MHKYVAFLRAINVGGHAIIKMEDLKRIFESFGLEGVQTYIQSGNVIFESKEEDPARLEKRIEGQLEKAAGHEIRLFVRTMREVKSIANQNLYMPKDDETVHVVFLNKAPDKKTKQALLSYNSEADNFTIKGRQVYNLRRDREKSVFSNNFIEKILRAPATTRNLTTIKKISDKYK
ncbi:MAG TPA: DUF1697 domain-containing protein [Anaerolineales bacterium]